MKNTLGKQEKLKSRKQIDALFKARKFVTHSPIRLFYQIQPDKPAGPGKPAVQAGFSCSKKFFKQANKRNRVKRLLRESYRLQKASLLDLCTQQHIHVSIFWLYGDKALPSQVEIHQKVASLLQDLLDIIHKKIQKSASA